MDQLAIILDLGPSSAPYHSTTTHIHPTETTNIFQGLHISVLVQTSCFFEGSAVNPLDQVLLDARFNTSLNPLSQDHVALEGTPQKKHEKKTKSTKIKENSRLLMLGEGIRLDKVMDTTRNFLVRRVCDREYTTTRLKKWVIEIWG